MKNQQHTAGCVKAFKKAEDRMKLKNYDRYYVLVDVHETMLKPNYDDPEHSTQWYDHAKDVMQHLSSRPEVILILWTCSKSEHVKQYMDFFESHGIKFSYYNENPECAKLPAGYGGSYDKKLFANVILDDKAGFDHEHDWVALKEYFGLPV